MSGIPPALVVTTGKPHANASSIESGWLSIRDALRNTSAFE
jgi:hypothetical protein